MIGGRVLDTSAIIAFADGSSIYAAALVWTAVEEGLVLLIPSSAVAAAWAHLPDKEHPVLEVLLQLPVTVVDSLDQSRARDVGALGGDTLDAHAVLCAAQRDWPLVTADAVRYQGRLSTSVEIEPLP